MRYRRPIAAGLLLAAVAGGWVWAHTPPRPRHVIVISIDTLRADQLGAYGNTTVKTPAIDALAAESVRFAWDIAAVPSTLAGHTSMFTGNPPHTHGVPQNDHLVHPDNVMLAELLRDAGFDTAAFLGAMPLGSPSGFTQGFSKVDERFTLLRRQDRVEQTMRPADAVTDAVLGWLDAREPAAPMFLFVHYYDVHAPYRPPEPYRSMYHPTVPDEDAGSSNHIQRTRTMLRDHDPAAQAHEDSLVALYQGGVSWVDAQVGRLMDGLRTRGLLEDAVVILTSDHGEAFDAHEELWDHGETVYDDTVHVPLIVRLPGAWHAGSVAAGLVSSIDLFPSVLELVGVPGPHVEGRSWLGQVRGDLLATGRPNVFAEGSKPHIPDGQPWFNDATQKLNRTDTWAFIQTPRAKVSALYAVDVDPGQREDVTSAHPDVAEGLHRALTAWRVSAKPLPSEPTTDERVRAELATLGYQDGTPAPEAPVAPSNRSTDSDD